MYKYVRVWHACIAGEAAEPLSVSSSPAIFLPNRISTLQFGAGGLSHPLPDCIKYRFSLLMPNDVEHVLLRLQQIDPLCSELFIYGHCVGEMKVSKQNKSSVIQVLRHQLPSSSALEGRGFHRCIHDVDNDLRRFDEIVRRQFRRISSRTSCSRKKRQ